MPAGSLLRASINHWIGVSTWHEWIPQNLGVPMILDWPCDMCELIAPFTLANPNVGANKPVTLNTLALGNGTGDASNYTLIGGVDTGTGTTGAVAAGLEQAPKLTSIKISRR